MATVPKQDGNKTTDIKIKNAKPNNSPYKISCGRGMYALIHPNGSKYFRMDYYFGEKKKTYALGVYSKVFTLKDARKARDETKIKINEGIDPSLEKKNKKAKIQANNSNNFKDIALAMLTARLKTGKHAKAHNMKVEGRFKNHLFPYVGALPIKEITASHIFECLDRISNKAETTRKMKQHISSVFSYAISCGKVDRNPANDINLDDLVGVVESKPFPYLIESELPNFLKAVNSTKSYDINRYALYFGLLTALRPGELRKLKWNMIDKENNYIRLPSSDMKQSSKRKVDSTGKYDHIIPLTSQINFILDSVKKYALGADYVFTQPTLSQNPISTYAVNGVISSAGYKERVVGHGFRHTMSTILNEHRIKEGFDIDAIELIIDHKIADRVVNDIRQTYNHSTLMPERIKILSWYNSLIESYSNGFFNTNTAG